MPQDIYHMLFKVVKIFLKDLNALNGKDSH